MLPTSASEPNARKMSPGLENPPHPRDCQWNNRTTSGLKPAEGLHVASETAFEAFLKATGGCRLIL